MARDFEDIHDIDDLGDDELRELVRTHLADNNSIDVDDINVHVEKGRVRLIGRVGTEGEARIAEHVVTDVLGIQDVSNELVVDEMRRAESPMAIDDHNADEEAHEGLLLGDRPMPFSDESQHLADMPEERLYGTTDVHSATQDGTPWIPPESPTPEGIGDSLAGDER